MSPIKVFLSHSSRDEWLARELIQCLEACLVIPPETLRCTSVAGYELEPGVSVSGDLKAALRSSDVVLGLLTENSLASGYVLMELGAAWGLDKLTCPILAPGIAFSRIPGPLCEVHAVALAPDKEPSVFKLAEVVAKRAGFARQPQSRAFAAVKRLLEVASKGP